MLVIDTAHFDQQILDRLETVQPATEVYDLEVIGSPAEIPGQPGRVRPYLVYQASGPGRPTQVELAEEGDSVVLRPIVKCVAAYRHDVVNLVAHTRAMLEHWSPTAPDGVNVAVSRLAFPLGFTPGNISLDRGETPARPWLLLQYAYTVST
jgi:hypothetical protein